MWNWILKFLIEEIECNRFNSIPKSILLVGTKWKYLDCDTFIKIVCSNRWNCGNGNWRKSSPMSEMKIYNIKDRNWMPIRSIKFTMNHISSLLSLSFASPKLKLDNIFLIFLPMIFTIGKILKFLIFSCWITQKKVQSLLADSSLNLRQT